MTRTNVSVPRILTDKADEITLALKSCNSQLSGMFKQCFLNTVSTTIQQLEDGSYFVVTGDIPAMWLRDSTAQVRPYVMFAGQDPQLDALIRGVIARQVECVLTDRYANAFNCEPRGFSYPDKAWEHPMVWERKYEVDSLCSAIELMYLYYHVTGSREVFTDRALAALQIIYDTFKLEQNHADSDYIFIRENPVVPYDTIPNNGLGNPTAVTGMTWSGFRPSDDACTYNYLIPANMMAVVALTHAQEILQNVYLDAEKAAAFGALAGEIRKGIETYGVVEHETYGKIYAYEVDGLGNQLLMDDANSPSLLSMPYFGYCDPEDPIYQNTRRFILSRDNPYFFEGACAKGMGSPHTPAGFVWHIGLTMQALTSRDPEEVKQCLNMILATDAGTGFMHESFNPDHPEDFTRSWFAWANTLFAELIVRLYEKKFFA